MNEPPKLESKFSGISFQYSSSSDAEDSPINGNRDSNVQSLDIEQSGKFTPEEWKNPMQSSSVSSLRIPILQNNVNENRKPMIVGELYQFTPCRELSYLLLYRSPSTNNRFSWVIRKKAIVMVLKRSGNFTLIAGQGNEGWLFLSENLLNDPKIFCPITSYQKYQDWKGDNYFYFNGRLMLSRDKSVFFLSLFLILGSTIPYFGFVLPKFPCFIFMTVLSSILLVIAVSNMILSAALDPGIFPRNSVHVKPTLPLGKSTIGPNAWAFCKLCNIYHPPRTKHCKTCDNCVEHFDHHCPFIANCVGIRNHRFFFLFIISLTLYATIAFIVSIIVISFDANSYDDGDSPKRFKKAILHNISAIITAIMSGILDTLMFPFTLYHLRIRSIGQTTYEQIKGIFRHDTSSNPYHKGCWKNYRNLCCIPIQPSRLPDLCQTCTIQDYVAENIDPQKHPEIIEKYHSYQNQNDFQIIE